MPLSEMFGPAAMLQATWYCACHEAELEGREFYVYGHPLLPGWRLHVNDPAAQQEEVKADEVKLRLRLKYVRRRRPLPRGG